MAYIHNRGILQNALVHKDSRWILKLDFQNFFNSIVPSDWDRAVRRFPELDIWKKDRLHFHNLFFWGCGENVPRCLSIGAPTSPSLSNLVCFKLDQWLEAEAVKRGLKVTRYADDITVSGPNLPQLVKFETAFQNRLARNKGVSLLLNDKKRGVYGPGERRMVTGLIITPEGKISIGRSRKREIHSIVHSCKIDNADADLWMRAKGLLSFARMADTSFYDALVQKYGKKVILKIASFDPEDWIFVSDEG